LRAQALLAGGAVAAWKTGGPDSLLCAADSPESRALTSADLPIGSAPPPVSLPHFPDRLHAFVWRNWTLVPIERLATVLQTTTASVLRIGQSMGLPPPRRLPESTRRRSALTVIRRNWHLLPYEQLLTLLGWTADEMAFALREDDFLYVKLGHLKPRCERLVYAPPSAATAVRATAIAEIMRTELGNQNKSPAETLFHFVDRLSRRPARSTAPARPPSRFNPRYCYSYFAPYGDPLLDPRLDAYPDGYLDRLVESGVQGVWLQGLLAKLAPFPWDSKLSRDYATRLGNLAALVERASRRGMGIYLYLNEPRAMPLAFYQSHPELKGVAEGDYAALCTSRPEVRRYLTDAVATVCRAVPHLAGIFTISGSENLTHCWSHGAGQGCARCGRRPPADVVAEANRCLYEGIRGAGAATEFIVWDWGWNDAWAEAVIAQLPRDVLLMSVSEWSIPIERGGIATTVGEYSLSAIGPGPRAQRHWAAARRHGLRTMAKIQAGNTWELSAVPYIPVVEQVARHLANLREASVDGLMLGWTLGGYPSPNLEVAAEMGRREGGSAITPEAALLRVAQRRFGADAAPGVVRAWQGFSQAFREFPFHGSVVYQAPLQLGPSNLLWEAPTDYRATMVGFPYDDLDGWRGVYPADVFRRQMEKVAQGFERTLTQWRHDLAATPPRISRAERETLAGELVVAEASAIHFRSTAQQARFVQLRQTLATAQSAQEAGPILSEIEDLLRAELALARRLHELQGRDSRLGFEASNQYYYVPADLAEKILNCRDLLDRWLPSQRTRFTQAR
jgi:hypothetical protein